MDEAEATDVLPESLGPKAQRRARWKRELLYFAIVGGAGIALLPLLVYLAGSVTLGPYDGGLTRFLGKLYGDLIRFSPGALGLLLGPYALFQGLRFLTRPLRHRRVGAAGSVAGIS